MRSTSKKYEYLAGNPHFKVMPIMLSLIIGVFFAILNEILLNIALTILMKELQVSLTTVFFLLWELLYLLLLFYYSGLQRDHFLGRKPLSKSIITFK